LALLTLISLNTDFSTGTSGDWPMATSILIASRSQRPALVIRPTKGWVALNLRELWKYRDLLWILIVRDLKLLYKQTALGAIWVVLQPLMAAVIFAVVFGRFA